MVSTSISMEASTFSRIQEAAAKQQVKVSRVAETAICFYLDVLEATEPAKVYSTYALLDRTIKLKGWKVEHNFEPPQ